MAEEQTQPQKHGFLWNVAIFVLVVVVFVGFIAFVIWLVSLVVKNTNPGGFVAWLPGVTIVTNDKFTSPNGKFTLTLLSDGTLVLLDQKNNKIWALGTASKDPNVKQYQVKLDPKGVLYFYKESNDGKTSLLGVSGYGLENFAPLSIRLYDNGSLGMYNAEGDLKKDLRKT